MVFSLPVTTLVEAHPAFLMKNVKALSDMTSSLPPFYLPASAACKQKIKRFGIEYNVLVYRSVPVKGVSSEFPGVI